MRIQCQLLESEQYYLFTLNQELDFIKISWFCKVVMIIINKQLHLQRFLKFEALFTLHILSGRLLKLPDFIIQQNDELRNRLDL